MSQSDDLKMMPTAASLANLSALVYDKLLVFPQAVADPGFARAKSFLAGLKRKTSTKQSASMRQRSNLEAKFKTNLILSWSRRQCAPWHTRSI
jgi:hypothetical protein